MIAVAWWVLAALVLVRVAIGLFVSTVVYLDDHPAARKRLGRFLAVASALLVGFAWWAIAPDGLIAALVWAAVIGLLVFVWSRIERRHARRP